MENEGDEGHHHDENVHFMYGSPSPGDSPVEEEVEKAEENERDEGHHQEENVVPHLVIVR